MINSVLFYSLFLIYGQGIAGVPAGSNSWGVVYSTLEQCQKAGRRTITDSGAFGLWFVCVPSEEELDD